MTTPITILSCVDGGTLERLARGFHQVGRPATVVATIDADDWRQAMTEGRTNRLVLRMKSFLGYPLAVLRLCAERRETVLVATTNPFFLPGLVVALRWLHRAPVVALIYDLWPNAAVADGRLTEHGLVARTARRYVAWWLRRADAVVFLGEGMRSAVSERYDVPAIWATIPTGADPAELGGAGVGNDDAGRWFAGELAVSYVGNMGAMHDVGAIRGAENGLTDAGLSLLVAGWGIGFEQLRSEIGSDSLAIRFSPPLDDAAWVRVLGESDVALITLRDEAAESSLPSKVFSALAAGCAIVAVARARSDVAEIVRSTGAGCVIDPGDSDALVEVLLRYDRDRALLAKHQEAARNAAHTRFDLVTLAHQWEDVVHRVEAGRSS